MNRKLIAGKSFLTSSLFAAVNVLLLTLVFAGDAIEEKIPFLARQYVFFFAVFIVFVVAIFTFIRERRFEVLKYEFVNIVTHKFRTPLTYIKWSVENLKKNQSADEKAESIRQVENAELRLTELTDILIGMARIDDGSTSYIFRAESVREIVEGILILYGDRMREKGINMSIQMAHGLPYISVDTKRIQFVIRTLIENAFKYTPEHGTVSIQVSIHGTDRIRFSVSDSGIGIRPEDLPHVFEKFFRSKEATGADTEGMGLGLYISRNIIERHGGKIWAESQGLFKGSTFIFELPLSR